MDTLIEGASFIIFAVFVLTIGFGCLWYVNRKYYRAGDSNAPYLLDDEEQLDAQEYANLKQEYIRRKMAKNKLAIEEDDVSNSGQSTKLTSDSS